MMQVQNAVALWNAPNPIAVSDLNTDPTQIASAALLLRSRERDQIVQNLIAENYEVATSFVWQRTMNLLKKQLATLGNEFLGELLQRPDITENSEVTAEVSDLEAIALARDLGVLTPTQAMRLVHSQQVVNHFASADDESLNEDEFMTREEAISCLRVCVQGVLGHDKIAVAGNFSVFRKNLESMTFTIESPDVVKLVQSPYLFVRTAVSVLLSVLKTETGATLEHASRNALLIIPALWDRLKKTERWQIGQAYASEFNDGHKETVRALHAVLMAVKGFDYVPENLRSNTFTKVASSVIAAHQGINNFYNEPAPMKELATLGTSIPSPAFPLCMTAALCVKLGNQYGVAWSAQNASDEVLNSVTIERWLYYLEDRLERDLVILPKLAYIGGPLNRWIELVAARNLDPQMLTGKVKALLSATNKNQPARVAEISNELLQQVK